MDFLFGIGKAGTGIVGGVVKGAGKAVESVGEATGTAGIVGGAVSGVVGGAGRAIESVGETTEDLGDALFGKKQNQKKTEANVEEEKKEKENDYDYIPYFRGNSQAYVSLDDDDDRDYYGDTLEDLMAYDAGQARRKAEEAADGGDE